MAIVFRCAHCDKKLKAPETLAGRKIKCPNCQSVVEVVEQVDPIEQSAPLSSDIENPTEPESADDAENPFAGDWMNSDDMEDPQGRHERIQARQSQIESKQLEEQAEEFARLKSQKKKKSSTVRARTSDTEVVEPFRYHWVYLLALIPLAIMVIWPGKPTLERLTETLAVHPDVESHLNDESSLTDLLMSFPDHAIQGALLPRDSLVHWLFGALSAGLYLGLLFVMFPGSRKRTQRLLLVGIFTGTIGILMLLAFQFIAAVSAGFSIRGRGIVVLIVLFIQLIGFSYRCTEDPSIGFWGNFFGFTVGVGLCEELCKSLPIWYYLRNAEKTGWRGACLVGLASGIGFGVSEGIMYSGSMYNGLADGRMYLVRFASCVSLHAIWSGSVALMMYANQDFLDADEWGDFLLGLLYYISISMILHGLYDTLLQHNMDVLALMIGIGSYFWLFYLVGQSRAARA